MLQTNNLIGFGAGLGGSYSQMTIGTVGEASTASDLTTYTFTSMGAGSAPTSGLKRALLACIVADDNDANRTVTGVTIGGVAAAQLAYGNNDGLDQGDAIIYMLADVSSGTTATVVVSYDISMNSMCVSLVPVYYSDTGTIEAADTASNNAGFDTTVTNAELGVSLAVGGSRGTGAISQDVGSDFTRISAHSNAASRHIEVASVETGVAGSVTADMTGSSTFPAGAAVALGYA